MAFNLPDAPDRPVLTSGSAALPVIPPTPFESAEATAASLLKNVRFEDGGSLSGNPPTRWADSDSRTDGLTPSQKLLFDYAPPPPAVSTMLIVDQLANIPKDKRAEVVNGILTNPGAASNPILGDNWWIIYFIEGKLTKDQGFISDLGVAVTTVGEVIAGATIDVVTLGMGGNGLINQGIDNAITWGGSADPAAQTADAANAFHTYVNSHPPPVPPISPVSQDSLFRRFANWVNSHLYIISQ